jgi:uncharacterized membrane protein YdbT with pleckstrin-like domain
MEPSYSNHPSMFKNQPIGFILAIILVPVFGLGLLILLWWYLTTKSVKLEITGGEIILEEGLLSKKRTEVNVSSVRTVQVYQSFFNRMFGVGKISVFTAGDNPEIQAAGMPDPHAFRDIIKGESSA